MVQLAVLHCPIPTPHRLYAVAAQPVVTLLLLSLEMLQESQGSHGVRWWEREVLSGC